MAKSSINFAKAKGHSSDHNLRKDEPSYLLPKEYRLENEFWQHEKKETEIFSESASKQKTGRKPKFENSRWEAIVNFNKSHTLGDLQKVATHIENKFNVTCSSIAMHKDEGHINERGIVEYNLHAHVNFITHKNGKQNWRKEFVKPKDLRELQTEVAELMGMERGTDKRISKTQRLEHTQFKQQVQGLAKQKDLKAEIAELRANLKAVSAEREQYAVLESLNRDLKAQIKAKDLTTEGLEKKLEEYSNKHTEKNKLINALEAKISTHLIQDTQNTNKNDLKAVSDELEGTNEVVPSIYELEEAERYGAGFKIHRFIEDKGTKSKREEKVSWLYKKEISTVTFDLADLEKLKEDLNQVDKIQIGLARKVLNAYNQVQSNLYKIKNFIKDIITPKKEAKQKKRFVRKRDRENVENKSNSWNR